MAEIEINEGDAIKVEGQTYVVVRPRALIYEDGRGGSIELQLKREIEPITGDVVIVDTKYARRLFARVGGVTPSPWREAGVRGASRWWGDHDLHELGEVKPARVVELHPSP